MLIKKGGDEGWAERNGGNISLNITDWMQEDEKALPALTPPVPLQELVPALGGHHFYVTGAGKRMRDVARKAWANGSVIRLAADGRSYEIVTGR